MNERERDYVRHRLSKAQEVLTDAEPPLRAGHYASAVNRIYYACFYAVSALLLSEGMSARKHAGVLSLFDRHWVKTGRLPRGMGEFLHDMFDRRLQGDYQDAVEFDPADVTAWLAQATQFVETIAGMLQTTE